MSRMLHIVLTDQVIVQKAKTMESIIRVLISGFALVKYSERLLRVPDSTVDDDLDSDIGGGPSHDGTKGQDKYSSYSSFLPDQGDRPAENDFSPPDNFPLVESDTIWEDGGKSFGMSHGHQYFVGCSGWTKKFKDNHRTHAIPDHVDEHILIKALTGRPMAGASCTAARFATGHGSTSCL
ncbi:hypothetical protein K438DRAFT_1791457 [Mycena galopus ATCC 62051]|nr:hypothetical protein K438DRAFT_1791457 [Mycena galopus ATCC 62051]